MKKKMETSIMGYLGLGFRKNGEENGNYYNGSYRDYCKDPFLHFWLTKSNLHVRDILTFKHALFAQ